MRGYCGVVAALALVALSFAPASFAQTGRVILGPAGSPQTSAYPGAQSLPASDGAICGPHPRNWDDGHALIREGDLTPEAVKKAEADIRRATLIPAESRGQFELSVVGGERLIRGYELKREYERDPTPVAKERFCLWMANEAFWPE